MLKPTVGRIVHYFDDQSIATPKAALIVEVELVAINPDTYAVSLVIFDSVGVRFKNDVEFSEIPIQGCWSWPSKV